MSAEEESIASFNTWVHTQLELTGRVKLNQSRSRSHQQRPLHPRAIQWAIVFTPAQFSQPSVLLYENTDSQLIPRWASLKKHGRYPANTIPSHFQNKKNQEGCPPLIMAPCRGPITEFCLLQHQRRQKSIIKLKRWAVWKKSLKKIHSKNCQRINMVSMPKGPAWNET